MKKTLSRVFFCGYGAGIGPICPVSIPWEPSPFGGLPDELLLPDQGSDHLTTAWDRVILYIYDIHSFQE